MKTKLFMFLLITGTVLVVGACTGGQDKTNANVPKAPDKYPVIIPAEDFNNNPNISKQIEVNKGVIFSIALDSNVTTGFQWTAQGNIGDTGILEQTTHNYIELSTNEETPIVGKAGYEEWTFKTDKTGTTIIKLSYDRPWEGGEKGVRTFELTVVVK